MSSEKSHAHKPSDGAPANNLAATLRIDDGIMFSGMVMGTPRRNAWATRPFPAGLFGDNGGFFDLFGDLTFANIDVVNVTIEIFQYFGEVLVNPIDPTTYNRYLLGEGFRIVNTQYSIGSTDITLMGSYSTWGDMSLPFTSSKSPQKPTRSFWSCAFSGNVAKAFATTTLDVLGSVPGGGNVLKGVQLAGAVGSTVLSLSRSFGDATVSAGSLGLSIADAEKLTGDIAFKGVGLIPILGNVVSGLSVPSDIHSLSRSYTTCRNGTN